MKTQIFTITTLAVGLCVIPAISFAQREIATQNYANTTDGSPVSVQKYENVTGTPYLNDGWTTGLVKFQDGGTYKEVKVKYDQVADELHFENKGQELRFVTPVSEFKITTSKDGTEAPLLFKNGFASDPKAFYQVLADGKTTLIKRNRKVIVDKTPFNSATAVKTFEPQVRYYLYSNKELISVKANKKSILSALSDKKDALDTYINKEKTDFNSDEDFGKLITYYNSL